MSPAAPYPWLKALHVAAAITFVSGVLTASLFLSTLISGEAVSADRLRAVQLVRRWDAGVTTPAMLVVWALGLTLALRGGWFASVWLPVKLIFVVALSGIHGVQSGTLRRLAGGLTAPFQPLRLATPLVIAFAVAIAVLAVVKPF